MSSSTLDYAEYVVAYHHSDHVKVLAYGSLARAETAYDAIDSYWAKVLIRKSRGNTVCRTYGLEVFCQQCIDVVSAIPSFFPSGSYRESARHVTGWYDTVDCVFRGCAMMSKRGFAAGERKCDFSFTQGERFKNVDGKLEVY